MDVFCNRLARAPRPYDPDAGAEVARSFVDLGPDMATLLAGAAGCSPYLGGLMTHEAAWLREAAASVPEAVLKAELARLDTVPPDTLGQALRVAKRRVALLVALADLGGVWALPQVTAALTALADRAVDLGIKTFVADEIRRGKLPGRTLDDAATGAGMVALAMGKMGAGELNYSSDIDLICLFDDSLYPDAGHEARAAFIRVTRKLTALLSDQTPHGYVFRTDLRLRPDASVMPVCLSMAAAEAYYESAGRTWERAAYIKARPCGGDLAAGARFLTALTPFVWRRHLDFAAIQDAHDMRLRIREHRGLNRALAVEGHDIKLGLGGIREIEFFTQTRQLIAGGRDPDLRDPTTVGGLSVLADKGWLPPHVAAELSVLYRAHREIEHRLQMVGDAQTHTMPTTPDGVARIAAFCDHDEAAFRRDYLARVRAVDGLTDGFFAPGAVEDGPALSDTAKQIVEGWGQYAAFRSPRAQEIFARVRPVLFTALQRAANPDEALLAFDGFLAGLPAGVQLFSLFEANPALVDLIVDIAGTSPQLARYLSRNASVLDAVLVGSFWAPLDDRAALHKGLTETLAAVTDYEARLNAARTWTRELHFRIGVHHLRGLIDAFEAGKNYADLAAAVVAALWPVVCADFAQRHGAAPGRGAVVLGMGSLGAGRLTAASDLDLIVIYDADGAAASDGPKPLGARPYYARLTQAMLTALVAPMPEGRLYEVDMRLRPSGRQGPVATAWQSFRTYQQAEAWTWEHLALTRARVIAGDTALAADVEAFRRKLLKTKGAAASVRADVAQMRARLQTAKPAVSAWDARNGPGRMMDIELCAEMLALLSGAPARGVERQIAAGSAVGLTKPQAEALLGAYRLCWRLNCAARLLSEGPVLPEVLGEGACAFLLRETGQDTAQALTRAVHEMTTLAAAAIDAQAEGGE